MSFEISDRQLNAHFKAALADAEALVEATGQLGDDTIAGVRARAQESLRFLKSRSAEVQDALSQRARVAANVTDAYVHDSPWEAIAIAGGVGLLIGVLVARR